jgi:hypothetical protein
MQFIERPLIGGKSIEEWDQQWVRVDGDLKCYHPELRHAVGLYRLWLNGQIVVIGTATGKAGCLAKRLSDFIRPSPSGRNYPAGRRVHGRRQELLAEVLIVDSDRHARAIARQLKAPMMQLHKPAWNVPKPFKRKV